MNKYVVFWRPIEFCFLLFFLNSVSMLHCYPGFLKKKDLKAGIKWDH